MHDIKALIAKDAALTIAARKFASGFVCRLVQGFSLLPIADALAKELTCYRGEQTVTLRNPVTALSGGLQALALEISYSSTVAYISTPLPILAVRANKTRSSGTRDRCAFRPRRQAMTRTGPTLRSAKRFG